MKRQRHFELARIFSGQALLSMTGLALGIAAVFSIQTLTLSVSRATASAFASERGDVLSVEFTRRATSSDVRTPSMVSVELVQQVRAWVPLVSRISSYAEQRTSAILEGRSYNVRAVGLDPSFFDIFAINAASGRTFSALDDSQPVILLGSGQARALAGAEPVGSLPGREIQIADTVFSVVGVLEPFDPGATSPFALNDAIILPAGMHQRRIAASGVARAIVAVEAPEHAAGVIDGVVRYFERNAGGAGLTFASARETREELAKQLRAITLLLAIIGAVAFLLGSSGVVNLSLGNLEARRIEVGLRRALGATRRQIRAWFTCEALAVCGVGSLAGLATGIAVTTAVARIQKWDVVVSPAAILLPVAAAMAIGFLAGTIAGANASRLDPALALRQHQ